MQTKKQNNSPVKQRVLYFINFTGISKREFYFRTGISRGTMDNSAGITEDTLMKLFNEFLNLNPAWVISGTGEMLLNNYTVNDSGNEHSLIKEDKPIYNCRACEDKEKQLKELNKTISFLRDQLVEANKDKEAYRSILSNKE